MLLILMYILNFSGWGQDFEMQRVFDKLLCENANLRELEDLY